MIDKNKGKSEKGSNPGDIQVHSPPEQPVTREAPTTEIGCMHTWGKLILLNQKPAPDQDSLQTVGYEES